MHNFDGVAPMIRCAMAGLNLLRCANGEPYDKSAIQNALDILERCRNALLLNKSSVVEDESVLLDMLIDYSTMHKDRDINDEVTDVYAIVQDVMDGKSVDVSVVTTFFSRMANIGINRLIFKK